MEIGDMKESPGSESPSAKDTSGMDRKGGEK